jgi:hypothetical protein
LLHRRQQEGNEDADNGDDDQQLDEGKTESASRPAEPRRTQFRSVRGANEFGFPR